ncbi:Predicted metalloprotease, contains C-terminal PDZ domain [Andreprevotia lacus DSM 23236]|jgi:predicted metalloprotease with PDZ domain|uniref:Predicted metalloprotease, contains C-terminal PDZ domain n=1 Tax=Andreprevotia lacus DSM 23236 TaxID=1121001 RepID=A0A1W1XPB7_9NEIS|nr:PDZ domain-containing protein [Andreprevotia lacus]SMC25813.1 Predicted metalloprotease, contains C-terminal PDZ domain [Andreprevotia lacus DSM 23236]
MTATSPIQYRIVPADLAAHLFRVTLTIAQPAADGQAVWLPVWIPGSYLVREFARNIVAIRAYDGERVPVALTKLDKHRWQAAPCSGTLTLEYEVYAFDLSVRGAYLDEARGFFNGTSVFLAVAGQETMPADVELVAPEGIANWRVATTLPQAGAADGAFGRYYAANYDELIDHPVELGDFTQATFTACGVPHDIVLAGRHRADMARLQADLTRICEYQIKLFGEPAPFSRYVFMTMVTGDGYGGLEHRASTALLASRDDLPLAHETSIKTGYRQYLGLCSHEYFHSWNVKRIKPAAYAPYDLTQENYTRLLWAFEGITSYYDDLTLVRCGLIAQQDYLDLLAQTMTQVERGAGRLKQTLEEASLDAWVKYYRQDENSPNALVSYYTKGALVAAALDLTIRKRSSGARSLDDVMRALWQRYGKDFATQGQGVAERDWEQVAQDATGLDLRDFFDLALRSTQPLPLGELLNEIGVQTQLRASAGGSDKGGWKEIAAPGNSIGAKLAAEAGGIKLTQVLDGGAARAAGLSAGDVLVAWDGLRVSMGNLDALLGGTPAGSTVEIHAFRRDELIVRKLVVQTAAVDSWGLRAPAADAAGRAALDAWLGGH